jgi:hypothetical protein
VRELITILHITKLGTRYTYLKGIDFHIGEISILHTWDLRREKLREKKVQSNLDIRESRGPPF